MKAWMQGPFLDITKYQTSELEVITLYPELFQQLFQSESRYSAFDAYRTFYHTSDMSYHDAKVLLENFVRCECCEQWFNRDDLLDTEQVVGGGVGLQCEDCAHTLG